MSDFRGRHFEGEIVVWAVRWYCRYGISYRDLEQMMGERGVSVDHSTIYRWVQKYAPEIEKRLRWHWRRPGSLSWRVDETYIEALRKGQAAIFNITRDIGGEARLVERAFGLGACALAEAMQFVGERLEHQAA